MTKGWFRALRNDPDTAIPAFERAQRLSPFDPLAYFVAAGLAGAHLAARRFEQAIEWADRALHDQPRMVTAMRIKISAHAHLGHLDEARGALARVLAIHPNLSISSYRQLIGASFSPEFLELMVAGLRLAGLPEK